MAFVCLQSNFHSFCFDSLDMFFVIRGFCLGAQLRNNATNLAANNAATYFILRNVVFRIVKVAFLPRRDASALAKFNGDAEHASADCDRVNSSLIHTHDSAVRFAYKTTSH
jgi:hypothetical protein